MRYLSVLILAAFIALPVVITTVLPVYASKLTPNDLGDGQFQVIRPGKVQRVATTTTVANSAALQSSTTVARIVCDAAHNLFFSSSPDGNSTLYIPAASPELFGVTPGSLIGASTISSTGFCVITEAQ